MNISNTWTLPQDGFTVFYRFFRDKISWYEADAVCQFHHANLVTGNDFFVQHFLFFFFYFLFGSPFPIYLWLFSFFLSNDDAKIYRKETEVDVMKRIWQYSGQKMFYQYIFNTHNLSVNYRYVPSTDRTIESCSR